VSAAGPGPGQGRQSNRRPALVLIALALVIALGAWLLLSGDAGESPGPEEPHFASPEQLRDLSAWVGHDVYWAGAPAASEEIELTHQLDGRIYVRYLGADGEPGDDRPRFTTVGTYPLPNAFAALGREAEGPEAITRNLPRGGTAYMDARQPNSVYLAWPGSGYEVEVFDPSPKHALDLVLAGAIRPVR
jgi:hypothetical protein